MAWKLATTILTMVVAVALVAPDAVIGLTCEEVRSKLAPCTNYLKNGGEISPACCNGVRSLIAAAATTADRQSVCNCLKQAASTVNLSFASSLPAKCGVTVPYPINPSVDCSTVK